jgi:hypothetical protein
LDGFEVDECVGEGEAEADGTEAPCDMGFAGFA